jgi:hypothetical protein
MHWTISVYEWVWVVLIVLVLLGWCWTAAKEGAK